MANTPAPTAVGYYNRNTRATVTVTIADSASLSDAARVTGYRIVGLIYPSGWDAAVTTFAVSIDDSTYNTAFDGYGQELSLASHGAGAGYKGLNAIQQIALVGAEYVKVRSGTVGSAVAQSGAVDIILVLEPI